MILLKKIRNFKLVLELEEIYSDVSGIQRQKKLEIKMANVADAYIFPTQQLNDLVNIKRKPFVIIHGTYDVEKPRKCNFNDNNIHVVYAGTLDLKKGGSEIAVKVANFLPANYHIHILGFGTKSQIEYIKDCIKNNSCENSAIITYDGVLSGEDYIRFIQSCQIGLSTQNAIPAFNNNSSFPSKILSYMSNGLRVVSAKIKVVEKSKVGDMIIYYNHQTPKEIAMAIQKVNFLSDYDSRKRINNLNNIFREELSLLLEEVRK